MRKQKVVFRIRRFFMTLYLFIYIFFFIWYEHDVIDLRIITQPKQFVVSFPVSTVHFGDHKSVRSEAGVHRITPYDVREYSFYTRTYTSFSEANRKRVSAPTTGQAVIVRVYFFSPNGTCTEKKMANKRVSEVHRRSRTVD